MSVGVHLPGEHFLRGIALSDQGVVTREDGHVCRKRSSRIRDEAAHRTLPVRREDGCWRLPGTRAVPGGPGPLDQRVRVRGALCERRGDPPVADVGRVLRAPARLDAERAGHRRGGTAGDGSVPPGHHSLPPSGTCGDTPQRNARRRSAHRDRGRSPGPSPRPKPPPARRRRRPNPREPLPLLPWTPARLGRVCWRRRRRPRTRCAGRTAAADSSVRWICDCSNMPPKCKGGGPRCSALCPATR